MSQLSLFKGLVGRVSVLMVFAVGAVGLFLMMGGLGEGQDAAEKPVEKIDYPENGTATVVAYIGDDPEGQTVTWSLSGDDAGDFEIDGGALTFRTPPDYERPTNTNTNNIYTVTVEASDGTTPMVEQAVRVRVTNVDEEGEATLSTVQPQHEQEITATLTDPDGDISEQTWQWVRGTSKSGPWTDITGENNLGQEATYVPAADDVGKWLRATASYNDGHCPTCAVKKTAQAISDNTVNAEPYANSAPVFDQDPVAPEVQVSFDEDADAEGVQMRIAENSPAGTVIGAPAAAKDLGQDGRQEILDYILQDNDFRSFDIDVGTGQIRVKNLLNFEEDETYSVTVRATDPSGASVMKVSTIVVNIMVTNVDEAPTITGDDTSINHEEKSDISTALATYTATDQDSQDTTLRWSLSGRDAAKFAIGNRGDAPDFTAGQLKFRASPDFEAPGDSGRDNVYDVTVEVTDSGGNKASREVTVKVTNVQEDGVVTLSVPQRLGDRARITARLTDPDGSIVNVVWEWAGGGGIPTDSSAYTIVTEDDTRPLTVTANYTDELAGNQTAEARVTVDFENKPPRFSDTSQERSVQENADLGTAVGAVVMAEDEDDGTNLTYSLGGTDEGVFTIHSSSGLISTAAALDYETKRSYRVTVTASDSSLRTASATVTISVNNQDEPAEITDGETAISYAENGTGSVSTYKATDPERATIVWTLAGNDAEDFSISSGGVLTFSERPDYEAPADSGPDNVYNVTVRASDGGENPDQEPVTVTVTNVDEPGKITLSSQQPQQDEEVTATPTDPDIVSGAATWQWARSTSRSGSWTDITGTDASDNPLGRSAMYMPTKDDVGKYLRVTARYTDGHGSGKSAQEVSENAVRRIPYANVAPDFKDAEGNPADTVGRTIAENSKVSAPVGDPVTATDFGENDRQEALTYTLSGNVDDAKFDIDRRTGQIKTRTILNFDSNAGGADKL